MRIILTVFCTVILVVCLKFTDVS